jgi:signal transduction histidine kinase
VAAPLLLWPAFRFGPRGAAAATLLSAVAAVWATIHGRGPFVRATVNESLLLLVGFVAVAATTLLIVSAALAERREAEEDVRRGREELKRLVEERTADLRLTVQALNEKAEELARSNLELGRFAATASHDLQAPLRKVLGFGERLRAKLDGRLDVEAADYLGRMLLAVTQMGELVENLLTLARVTTRAKALVEVDLSAVAREALGDLEPGIAQLGGRVELGPLPRVRADALQMRQLLQNLLSNALKFRRKGVPPWVRVSGRVLGDGFCTVTVEDNGIGFEESQREQIFKPFQRLHSRFEFEGCGLGLAICAAIAMRHGGSVEARGYPGEGAVFVVTLPTPFEDLSQSPPRKLEVAHGAAN